jgi:hypothetical protein
MIEEEMSREKLESRQINAQNNFNQNRIDVNFDINASSKASTISPTNGYGVDGNADFAD